MRNFEVMNLIRYINFTYFLYYLIAIVIVDNISIILIALIGFFLKLFFIIFYCNFRLKFKILKDKFDIVALIFYSIFLFRDYDYIVYKSSVTGLTFYCLLFVLGYLMAFENKTN